MGLRTTLLSAGAAAVILGAGAAIADRLEDTFYVPLDHPAIQYNQDPADDPVGRLGKKLETGQAKLDYNPKLGGYLLPLLKQLNLNTDSQVLVFSRTSIQVSHINPRTPRAIYFNDDVTLGYVPEGDLLELTSVDPKRGVFLYTMDAEKDPMPSFARRDDCLRCHQGPITLGVPGLVVSSLHPSTAKDGDVHGHSFMTDDRTPLEDRWGGWYVTGTHGAQRHMGNNLALIDPLNPGGPSDENSQNWTSLPEVVDAAKYPVQTSDIVALLTLEHQVRMTNLIIRIGWDARIAEHDQKLDAEGQKTLDDEIEDLVSYMVFAKAVPLKAPVKGTSTFTKTFPERGPRDPQGRSLRDFDLKTRVFRYPLSYMIYSAAFDNLPDVAKNRIYQRLFDVLSGKDQSETFANLSAGDRKAALEIVRETKKGLPEYFNAGSKTP